MDLYFSPLACSMATRIALAEADRHGLPMAVSRLVAGQEERLIAAGYGDEDNSALARVAKGEVA